MRIYPLANHEGRVYAVEVENVYVSPWALARLFRTVDGVTAVRARRLFSGPEIHVTFTFRAQPFVVWEPYGDNSRYFIGPSDPATQTVDIQPLLDALSHHRVSVLRQLLGDLLSFRVPFLHRA